MTQAAQPPAGGVDQFIRQGEVTDEEAASIGAEPSPAAGDRPKGPPQDGVPDWAEIPAGLKPPRGKQLVFMRFRAAWTDDPSKGDRHCVLWSLTDNDEKLALSRTRGVTARGLSELAKQTIRAMDGKRADWVGKDPDGYPVPKFWEEIGPKCRQLVVNYYAKMHMMEEDAQLDFFTNCIAFARRD